MPLLNTTLRTAALPLVLACTALLSACGASSDAPEQASVTPPANNPNTPAPAPAPEEPPCVAI